MRYNMKLGIFAAMSLVFGSTAYAGSLEFCNQTSADSNNQSSYQAFNSYRGQISVSGTGLAPSITLPGLTSGMRFLRIDFQKRNNFLYCMDSSSPNNWCGTNPPTGTISNTAWVYHADTDGGIKLLKVSNTIPTVLYVSGTGVTGYSMCGMQ